MEIPNDTGHPYRMNKFVEYQHIVPPIEPTTYIAYARENNLNPDECIMIAWYNSMSYCSITAIFLFNKLKGIQEKDLEAFWAENKNKLIFASARKYVGLMDWFIPLMIQFHTAILGQPFEWVKFHAGKGTAREKYDRIYKLLMKWQYMGRFSVDLFVDALVQFSKAGLIPIEFQAEDFDWRNGSNITTGMFNVFYRDDEADLFDKNKTLTKGQIEWLETGLKVLLKAIIEKYPETTEEQAFQGVTQKLCSFRNLWKGARYGGYHHDRQLEQLRFYQEKYPNEPLWNELFELRKKIFEPQLLGEIGGWNGIRKERKKLWITQGLTGVENINKQKGQYVSS